MHNIKRIFSSRTFLWVSTFFISVIVIILAFLYKDKLAKFRSFGLFGVFLANLLGSAIPFIPVPGIVTVVVGGVLYSPFLVALLATVGAVIGDMFCFLLGLSGKKLLIKKEYAFYEKTVILMKKYGAVIIFLFAFVPNPIFDTVGIIAGVLEYPSYKFFLWLFVGRMFRNILLAFFGAQLEMFH